MAYKSKATPNFGFGAIIWIIITLLRLGSTGSVGLSLEETQSSPYRQFIWYAVMFTLSYCGWVGRSQLRAALASAIPRLRTPIVIALIIGVLWGIPKYYPHTNNSDFFYWFSLVAAPAMIILILSLGLEKSIWLRYVLELAMMLLAVIFFVAIPWAKEKPQPVPAVPTEQSRGNTTDDPLTPLSQEDKLKRWIEQAKREGRVPPPMPVSPAPPLSPDGGQPRKGYTPPVLLNLLPPAPPQIFVRPKPAPEPIISCTGVTAPDDAAHPPVPCHREVWLNSPDYPSDALRAGHSVLTIIKMEVDEAGRVSECSVTVEPEGYTTETDALCAKVTRRARFRPARNGELADVASHYTLKMHWKMAGGK